MSPIGVLFLGAVLARAATSIWLSGRQIRAATRRRSEVPRLLEGVVSAADREQAADYTAARMRLARFTAIANAAVALLLTFGGGIAAADTLWRGTGLGQPWLGTAVVLTVLGSLQVVALPFSAYRVFGLEAGFGFNRTTPRLFAADFAKRMLIAAAFATPVVAGAVVLVESGGPWWWLAAWVGWLAVFLALTWAWPRFVAPLFNRFAPLGDAVLEQRIAGLLRRCGFELDGVFVMDGSRRSAHGNAYFTGLGRHKRIVFLDTLLERLDTAGIEAVLAHELGHFRLNHVAHRFAASALLALAGLAVLAWLAAHEGFYAALGVGAPSAHATLALAIVAAPVALFFVTPLRSAWARRQEIEADDFAVRHAGAAALADALAKIHRDNRADLEPDAVYAAFYATHPPPYARIARLRPDG